MYTKRDRRVMMLYSVMKQLEACEVKLRAYVEDVAEENCMINRGPDAIRTAILEVDQELSCNYKT